MTIRNIFRQGAAAAYMVQISRSKANEKPIYRLFCLRASLSSDHAFVGIKAETPLTLSNLPVLLTSAHPASTAANYMRSNSDENDEIVSLLQRILDFTDPKKGGLIIQNHKQFQSLRSEDIMKTWKFMEKKGISLDCVRSMPWLLAMDIGTMESMANALMSELKIQEFRTAVPFFQLFSSNSRRLSRIAYLWNLEIRQLENTVFRNPDIHLKYFANRIEIISYWLNCEPYEVSEMMRRVPMLMSASLRSLEGKIKTMLDSGIPASDVIKDPYIFTNMLATIENRLALCKSSGLASIKPWMLRRSLPSFNAYVQRRHQEQDLLQGHKDITSFLSKSLQCTAGEAKEILLRVPSVKSASATKLNEMIQFLFSQGFTRDHILEMPRILGHSVETADKRIGELRSIGFNLTSLSVLTYTSTHYNNFRRKIRQGTEEEDVKQ